MEVNTNTIRSMERNSSNADFNLNPGTAAPRVDNASRVTVDGSPPNVTAESLRSELSQLQETLSAEFFDKFIQEANARLFPTNRKFNYDFHEATNRIVVRIVDSETDEIIREIPPEKILNVAEKMLELVGVIFDERV